MADKDNQYDPLFNDRLNTLRARVEDRLAETEAVLDELLELNNLPEGKHVTVIGQIYVQYSERTSAIETYGQLLNLTMPIIPSTNIVNEEDEVFVEDRTGRVRLDLTRSPIPADRIISGTVVGIGGFKRGADTIEVDIITHPAPPPPAPVTTAPQTVHRVLLVSGLRLGRPATDPTPAQALERWLTGKTPSTLPEVDEVMLLGNSVAAAEEVNPDVLTAPYLDSTKVFADLVSPVHLLDDWLGAVTPTLPVAMLSGASDPAPQSLPQPPMATLMFPSVDKGLTPRPNPWTGDIKGLPVIATAGKSVADIRRMTHLSDPEIVASLIRATHLSPTAPESLDCEPTMTDEGIIRQTPTALLVGNCGTFDVTETEGVQGVSVPDFSVTGIAVIMEIEGGAVRFSPVRIAVV